MKETLIDILIYLFENYVEDDISLGVDGEQLKSELDSAGFEPVQVNKAKDTYNTVAIQEKFRELNIDYQMELLTSRRAI